MVVIGESRDSIRRKACMWYADLQQRGFYYFSYAYH